MAKHIFRREDEERTELLGHDELFVQKGKGSDTYYNAWLHDSEIECCPRCGSDAVKTQDLFSKTNVKAEYLDLNDVATIMVTKEEAEKYALSPGELLMTEGGDRDKLGRGTIWNGEIPECLHQNHVFAVRVNEKYMLTEYLGYLTVSPVGRVYFDITAKKTTNLASTNSTTILQFTVPVPSLEEQRKIVEMLNQKCASINEIIDEKQKLIDDLESYKKSLIFEVVTGKKLVV